MIPFALSLSVAALGLVALASPSAAKQGPQVLHAVQSGGSSGRAPTAPSVGERYPHGRLHSPVTADVAARWRALATREGLHRNVVAKIGASATENLNFLRCLGGSGVAWGEHGRLADTLAFFNEDDGRPGWTNPFRRVSLSAKVGWHAGRAIRGRRPALSREVRAVDPQYAVVLYGTNDLGLRRPYRYARNMRQVVHMLEVRGVIPIMTTIMPRDDSPRYDKRVGLYNAVVRSLAQARRLPLIDFHHALSRLPDHGLARDGVHPRAMMVDGRPRACVFTEDGLRHGHNLRNLLTLETLDQLRRVVVLGEDAPDRRAPPLPGRGSAASPFAIDRLPFSHAGDTLASPHRDMVRHDGCDGGEQETASEYVYRMELQVDARVYGLVTAERGVDVDLYLLRREEDGWRCVRRSDEWMERRLTAGSYRWVVDTPLDRRGRARPGEFRFVVARTDRPSDPD